jgi:hypothetical protein
MNNWLQSFVEREMLGGVMLAGDTASAVQPPSGSSRPEPGDLGKEGR